MADDSMKKSMPLWTKRLLLVISIVGPLAGAAVTLTTAYFDIRAKANTAKAQTKASYETLAPAVKELQVLLVKTQDVVFSQEKEIAELRAAKDDEEKRIVRLEAYVDILGQNRNLPAPPPEVQEKPEPVTVKVRRDKPAKLVPSDVGIARQYQDVRAKLNCSASDPTCDMAAAAQVDSDSGEF